LKEYNTRYEREFQRLQGFYQDSGKDQGREKIRERFTAAVCASVAAASPVVDWRNRLEERKWESLGF